MAVGPCDLIQANFCESQKSEIDIACHDLGKQAGKEIMYQVDHKTCYCICSCVGAGTEITLGDGGEVPVEQVVPGQTQALAAGLDLNFHPAVLEIVSAAAPGHTDNTIFLSFTLAGTARGLVLTMDHPVLVQGQAGDRKLVAAGALQPDDRLVDQHGTTLPIDSIRWGSYDSGFYEVATNLDQPDGNYTGHLILTGGIVTGDFAITTWVNLPLGLYQDAEPEPERPIVGSPEWRDRHDYTPAEEQVTVNGAVFTPAELHRIEVPAHASPFLPSSQAAELEDPKVPKRKVSDQYYLEECEWLIDKVFRPLYPDVSFLFDWYSDTVNSFSWAAGKQKFVYLSGGLARVEGFDYEGTALALAHEIGHLYGTPVRNGVTCEGEADWYGASIVMRKLWFGEYYFEYAQKAIDQLQQLYAYLAVQDEELVDLVGDPYPSNACRLETLEAALQSPKIPECAKCPAPPEPVPA